MRVIGRAVLLSAAAIALGCATQRELIDRNASAGPSPCSFWPPPPSTSFALGRKTWRRYTAPLSDVARGVAASLSAAGYTARRWYPIGLEYRHGFAATTRLEAVNDDAAPMPHAERWSSFYPGAATLRWLTLARTMSLPNPGRYRVFLIAVTDLPLGPSALAPVWNEDTVMDGPGVSIGTRLPAGSDGPRDLSAYRVGVYVYQYERRQDEARGRASPSGTAHSAIEQMRAASLAESALVSSR